MLIRRAEAARDSAACAAIYAPYVLETAVSFEAVPPDAAELARRIGDTSARYPWLVAETGGALIGYAYASTHRERAAYRWTAEVAVYVDRGHRRQGAGRALYEALLEQLGRQGIHMACAGITLPNDASVALHEACGFQPVGIFREVGWKLGAWRDVGWWQRELRPAEPGTPAEPSPPA